jgi:hypothetical protein
MSRKRLLVLAGLVLAAVAVSGGVLLLLPGQSKVPFRAKFDQVWVGMTPEEVHAIMGQPDAVNGWPNGLAEFYIGGEPSRSTFEIMPNKVALAKVVFIDGRVARTKWAESYDQSLLGSLRERLGW